MFCDYCEEIKGSVVHSPLNHLKYICRKCYDEFSNIDEHEWESYDECLKDNL